MLSRIDDWHSERFQFCNSLFRQYHTIQQNSGRTSITHQNGIQETLFSKAFNETQQVAFFLQGNPVFRTHFEHNRDSTATIVTQAIQQMQPPTTPKQVQAFLGLVGYYRKFIKSFAKIAKPLTLLTRQQVKFDWMPSHHKAFLTLKEAIVQAPILCYPDPNRKYIVYTDASDDACGGQLLQEHNGMEFPIGFLSHMFTETQRKWSTTEQEAYVVYYAVTKWNYYLKGADIIGRNDHKPLAKFLNGKKANNKVNRWVLEVATYNITFEWISGDKNKAADCLSRLVE